MQKMSTLHAPSCEYMLHRRPQGVNVVIMPGSIARRYLNIAHMFGPKLLREFLLRTMKMS